MFTRKADETASGWPIAARILTGNDVRHYPAGPMADWGPQQQELNAKWSWYTGSQYSACRYNWDGEPQSPHSSLAKALVPQSTGIPPGFRSMGQNGPRMVEKKPSAPHKLVARVVDRFTALLFAEDAHPVIRCVGDEKTEHWLASFISTSRLWAKMSLGRALGGGQGAVAVAVRVVGGEPRIEPIDLRFAKPVWADKEALLLRALDMRWQVPAAIRRDKRSPFETAYYWQRRLISDQAEIWYRPVWCADLPGQKLDDGTFVETGNGDEPDWQKLIDVERSVRHDLGFCPVLWLQNLPNHESPYGKSDVEGLYEQAMDIDRLRASISKAIIANMDPTWIITGGDGTPVKLSKGSGNGVTLPQGFESKYMEISGGGIQLAQDWFEKCRDAFFEEAECSATLGKDGQPPQTAFEVASRLGPQHSKTALLREQYGQLGVRKICDMAIRIERVLQQRGEGMVLEPRVVRAEEEGGEDTVEPVELGPGGYLEVVWPPLVRPTPTDIQAAATAATAALQGSLIDQQLATKYTAPLFGEENVPALLSRIKAAKDEQQEFEQQQQVAAQKPPV